MKLTDEIVAKALGWKRVYDGNTHVQTRTGLKMVRVYDWQHPDYPHPGEGWGVKPYTTSLDAIVGEIEARGLDYTVSNTKQANVHKAKRAFALVKDDAAQGDTAQLALCAALLAYLKENP
jgi:hypothetical protein